MLNIISILLFYLHFIYQFIIIQSQYCNFIFIVIITIFPYILIVHYNFNNINTTIVFIQCNNIIIVLQYCNHTYNYFKCNISIGEYINYNMNIIIYFVNYICYIYL